MSSQDKNYRKSISGMFPSAYREESQPLNDLISTSVAKLNELRPSKNEPVWLGKNPELTIDFNKVQDVDMPLNVQKADDVINQMVKFFEGYASLENPLNANNLTPTPNMVSIIAGIFSQIFPAQILEGGAAWNLHHAELESAGMLANMFGWEPTKARCIYTYGGSGCWTYGVKYGLTRVLGNSRKTGVRTDAKVICSTQAHYTKYNSTDWTGLGTDQLIQVSCNNDDNSMDMVELEKVLKDLYEKGTPVACVVCTAGTTDANAIDAIKATRALMDKYPNKAPYGKAVLYIDAVAQWSWLAFKKYDFAANPLEFDAEILPHIQDNLRKMAEIECADAVGVDFHKVGWAPLVSSAFIYKDAQEFETLLTRSGSAYLQDRNAYNPRYYTLEVSRSQCGSLTGWAALKFLGYEGFQAIVGGNLQMQYKFRQLIKTKKTGVCVNPNNHGFDCMFRVYPDGIDPETQYDHELNDINYRDQLIKHNKFNEEIGDLLFKWWRSGHLIDGKPTPRLSYSTGYRAAAYDPYGEDADAKIYALKVFPMNPNVTEESINWMYTCIMAAREEVLKSFTL